MSKYAWNSCCGPKGKSYLHILLFTKYGTYPWGCGERNGKVKREGTLELILVDSECFLEDTRTNIKKKMAFSLRDPAWNTFNLTFRGTEHPWFLWVLNASALQKIETESKRKLKKDLKILFCHGTALVGPMVWCSWLFNIAFLCSTKPAAHLTYLHIATLQCSALLESSFPTAYKSLHVFLTTSTELMKECSFWSFTIISSWEFSFTSVTFLSPLFHDKENMILIDNTYFNYYSSWSSASMWSDKEFYDSSCECY